MRGSRLGPIVGLGAVSGATAVLGYMACICTQSLLGQVVAYLLALTGTGMAGYCAGRIASLLRERRKGDAR